MRWVLLLFVVLPILEIWLLARIGGAIGFWPTLGALVAVGFVGVWLAKREGRRVLRAWTAAVSEQRPPEQGIVSGVLVVAGAALLVLPGVVSDALGLLLLVSPARRLVAQKLRESLERKFERAAREGRIRIAVTTFASAPDAPRGPAADPAVIDVEGEPIEEVPPARRLPR